MGTAAATPGGDFEAGQVARRIAADDLDFPRRLVGVTPAVPGIWVGTRLTAGEACIRLWQAPAVAIVGARGASAAGLSLARELAWGVARAGVVVVSGLARGIDGAAHEGALLAEGRTVAVLGGGLDACYPPEHTGLAERIAQRGAVITEWPAGTAARPWRFPRRNRIVSGLADIVVLVEGEARSGARHTVDAALALGREVMAVPRDPLLPGSVTPNRLLRDGAAPATSAEDVLAALAFLGAGPSPGIAAAPALPAAGDESPPPGCPAGLPQQAAAPALRARILEHVRRGSARTVGELAERNPTIPADALLASLLTLEIEGEISRDSAGRMRAR